MNNSCLVDTGTLTEEDSQIYYRNGAWDEKNLAWTTFVTNIAGLCPSHFDLTLALLRSSVPPVNIFGLSSNKPNVSHSSSNNAVGITLRVVSLLSVPLSDFPSVTTRTPSRYLNTRGIP